MVSTLNLDFFGVVSPFTTPPFFSNNWDPISPLPFPFLVRVALLYLWAFHCFRTICLPQRLFFLVLEKSLLITSDESLPIAVIFAQAFFLFSRLVFGTTRAVCVSPRNTTAFPLPALRPLVPSSFFFAFPINPYVSVGNRFLHAICLSQDLHVGWVNPLSFSALLSPR